jgi:hypothetical protein
VTSPSTNAQGQASTTYTASTTSSAANGVVISASTSAGAVTGQTSLTVAGQTVGLSLGTGGKIADLPNSSTQYEMPWSVQAINPAGNGVPGVSVSFAVTSLSYLKGQWSFPPGATKWQLAQYPNILTPDTFGVIYAGVYGCRSEDVNNNGVLDVGEDYNNNHKLDPGLVASTDISSGTTDSNGSITVNLIYPKDHSMWTIVRLTVTAYVAGTENSSSVDIQLPLLASDFPTDDTFSPPNELSPYGQANTCGSPN